MNVAVGATPPVSVAVGVTVGVELGATDGVGDWVAVHVGVGEPVGVAVSVAIGVGVLVWVGVADGVPAAGVGVAVAEVVDRDTVLRIVTEFPALSDPIFHCIAIPISTMEAETEFVNVSELPLFRSWVYVTASYAVGGVTPSRLKLPEPTARSGWTLTVRVVAFQLPDPKSSPRRLVSPP